MSTTRSVAWLNTVEWRLAARQNRVAAYNGETETPGYGIVHLRTRWQATKSATSLPRGKPARPRVRRPPERVNRVTAATSRSANASPVPGGRSTWPGEYRW